jgi:hypothetical protein
VLDEVRYVLQNNLFTSSIVIPVVLAVSLQLVAHCCQLTVTLYGDLTLVVGECSSYSFTRYHHRH